MRRFAFLADWLSSPRKQPDGAPLMPPDTPLRADYYPDDALAAMAKKIAAGTAGSLPYFTPFRLSSRLNENARVILHTFHACDAAARRHETISPATQWLIDNYYTIDKAIKQIRLSFPQQLMRRLPPYPPMKSVPRIFALAWFYVAHTDSIFSVGSLTAAVRAYQTVAPLTIAELWILPAAMRFVLVENARRIAAEIEHNTKMRLAANKAADEIIQLRKSGKAMAPEDMQTRYPAHYNAYIGDTNFSAQLLSRLENAALDTTVAIKWLHYKISELAAAGDKSALTGGDRPAADNNRQAANGMTMGNIIRAFKAIDDIDWTMWFESVCAVDFVLRDHSDFSELDAPSRNAYRSAVETIAKKSPLSEVDAAAQAMRLAQADKSGKPDSQAEKARVAEYLLGKKRPLLEAACRARRTAGDRLAAAVKTLKIGSIALPVSALALIFIAAVYSLCLYAGLSPWRAFICAALAALPAADSAFAVFNTLVAWYLPPKQLVGYAYQDGIPPHAHTLIAVPVLISSPKGIDEQIRNLEVHYLSNPRGALHFALVSDWKDSDSAESPADLKLLEYARAQMAALNRRCPAAAQKADGAQGRSQAPLFFLLHRRRRYNDSENCYMGWERKRGKLHELNRLLRGAQDTSFFPPDAPLPADIRYVMTLDSDTRLTLGSVAKIVGKLSHPLNSAKIDAQTQTVREGYGIIQPRVTPSLAQGADASVLQRVFSGERGLDPYIFAVSDTYQDMVGEGTYTGKGLYDIDAFEAALQGRIQDNRILSHDLLEGGYARAAFAGDVEVVEDYPISYYVDTNRRHRWIRGDWQLLPYIFGSRSVSGITRWKMLDNLRRSLMAPAFVAAFVGGWCLLPFKAALLWQLGLLAAMYSAPLLGLARRICTFNRDYMLRGHIRAVLAQAGMILFHMLLHICFLAYSVYSAADAVFRTLYRLCCSKKHLLEWQSSDAAKNLPKTYRLSAYMRMMAPAFPIALAAFIIAALWAGSGLIIGLPFIALWLISPLIAWVVSRPAAKHDALKLKAADAAALRLIARRDWAFYEAFVTAENHHLPPDNFQEQPQPVLARRTSPTNIGLYLLSTLAARDFGWISLTETLDRLEATIATLEKLEKFRGHIYNWYETDTLKPLEPLYISTVDSGNLAGHLVTLAAALNGWAAACRPADGREADSEMQARFAKLWETDRRGIADNAALAAEALDACAAAAKADKNRTNAVLALQRQLAECTARAAALSGQDAAGLTALRRAAEAIAAQAAALDKSAGSEASRFAAQTTAGLAAACRAAAEDAAQAAAMRGADGVKAQAAFARRLSNLGGKARRLAFAMQFGFLELKERRLLSIGYRVREKETDEGAYDLLASEARLAVLFAIAKGDIKYEYWGRLGRVLVAVGWQGALLSWSGSMFEYLMPPLVMKEPRGSILEQTARLAVRRQIEYGAELGLPWGISEAAFNARDVDMNYQYSAFGVPSLGLQRDLSRNRVIAPYAALLAAQYAPHRAVINLKKLRQLGAEGQYGYYDSLDFTPSRVRQGEAYAVIRNYYAHHHGMSIVAVANAAGNNIMRERFHSDPAIQAVELLLQEKAPHEIPIMNAKAFNPLRSDRDRAEENFVRIIAQPIAKPHSALLLAGGAYSLMINAKGSGYSRWNGFAVTRYQADATEDSQGGFLFLRDVQTGRWWSACAEPTRMSGEETKTLFTAEKAEFYKHIDGIHSLVECLVTAGGETRGEGEGRRIKLYNQTNRDRVIDIVSYSELALNDPPAEAAHPVFSHMFVETEITDSGQTIFAHRRSRAAEEAPIHAVHFVAAPAGEILAAEALTDRRAFIGRGHTLRRPAFFDKDFAESGGKETGAENKSHSGESPDGFVMDPIFSIRCRVTIPAHKKLELVFWTLAAQNREKLANLLPSYRRADAFEREFTAVWTYSQIIRHQIGLSPKDVSDYQKYAAYLLYPEKQWLAPKLIAKNLGKQSDLWPMSLSGDAPICVLRIADEADMPVVRELLRAHAYWRSCGLIADLVLVNERQFSYAQDTQRSLEWVSEAYRSRSRDSADKPHIFTLRKDQMSSESYQTLLGAAQIVLHAANGSLAEQLAHLEAAAGSRQTEAEKPLSAVSIGLIAHDRSRRRAARRTADSQSAALAAPPAPAANPQQDLRYWNGFGGFAADGSYVIRLKGQQSTPQPWINIISNDRFGMHISAGGAPFTWADNSRDYQLTPWSNDPVSNRPGEALYIVDLVTKQRFSPVSAVECQDDAIYEARHGCGYSAFSSEHGGLLCALTYTVDKQQPLRFAQLRLTNRGASPRRLRLYNYAEWVLGNNRAKTAPFLIPSYDAKRAAMLVANPYSIDKSGHIAFIAASQMPSSITADRAEFIGAAGTVKHPQAIRSGGALSGKVEAGGDSCAAMSYDVELAAGESKEIIFCLGHADSLQNAQKLLDYARLADFNAALAAQKASWQDFTAGLQVETPDDSFNLLVNHWLPYQAYACRIMARAAFYQASGAFGLRDQLQDTLALLLLKPALARSQIVTAASRQFKEGDLQHWWLPESGAGVRTLISDDVVWLAYATALYVTVSGETALLDEEIPFIEGAALAEGHSDSYFRPAVSADKASLYQHCCLALDLAIKRTGENGLPLMLGGDWNDGMNHVGAGGKGESVWLGWFLGKTLSDFIPLAKARNDTARAAAWAAHLETLKAALEKAGWDGAWYRRAYYDDGSPLGSQTSDEDKIDTIAQSWSIISGLAPPERQRQAFQSMLEQLYDKDAQLLRLFWPPFNKTAHNPGYIKAYPPGIRENGGQYTHGALWSIIAAAQLGENETAYQLFSMANPIHHGAKPEIYRVEPYVVAADIYSVAPRRGMGGWTWYTGSAGWLYRAATEAILGLKKQGDRLFLSPVLPQAWPQAQIKWRHEQALYRITIKQSSTQPGLTVNGQVTDSAQGIALQTAGEHEIILSLGAKPPAAAVKTETAAEKAMKPAAVKSKTAKVKAAAKKSAPKAAAKLRPKAAAKKPAPKTEREK